MLRNTGPRTCLARSIAFLASTTPEDGALIVGRGTGPKERPTLGRHGSSRGSPPRLVCDAPVVMG